MKTGPADLDGIGGAHAGSFRVSKMTADVGASLSTKHAAETSRLISSRGGEAFMCDQEVSVGYATR